MIIVGRLSQLIGLGSWLVTKNAMADNQLQFDWWGLRGGVGEGFTH